MGGPYAGLDTSNAANPDGLITTRRAWDRNSRLVAQIDDQDNATAYAYDALSRRVAALRKQRGGRPRPLHEQLLHRQREQLMRGSKLLRESVDDQQLAIVPATYEATTGAVRSLAPRAQLLPVALLQHWY